ncbi:TPA: hypothetical protein HA231_04310 [Candidatus Woesearchaeota archaeon]|nr:hypothetical protein [Candidatus Woesearchaeota archaeon]
MAGRKKQRQPDSGKNRKLDEFLRALKIAGEKRDRIVSFVEELTFKRLKELSTGVREGEERKPKLRLRMPWDKT